MLRSIRGRLAGSFYEQYLGKEPIEREAPALLEGFTGITAARIQVFNADGAVLADSLGMPAPAPAPAQTGLMADDLPWADLQRALTGEVSSWQGKIGGEPALAVSAPLKREDAVAGAVRCLSSLDFFYREICCLTEASKKIITVLTKILSIYIINHVTYLPVGMCGCKGRGIFPTYGRGLY